MRTSSILAWAWVFLGVISLSKTGVVLAQESSHTLQTDWRALVALYQATDGGNWNEYTNWSIQGTSPPTAIALGQWHGVDVRSGRVVAIRLQANNLSGHIPAELGDLTALEILNLKENNLTGRIPEELANLEGLAFLNLRSNQLTGELPATLENAASLQGLWLHDNNLSGPIPAAWENISDLEALWISRNAGLRGPMVSLPSVTSLELTGTDICIPPEPKYAQWRATLGGLRSQEDCLMELEWSALTDLYRASDGSQWITANGWETAKRPSVVEASEWFGLEVRDGHVVGLHLSDNNLSGALPESVGSLRFLEELDLGSNDLSGPLPVSMATLTNLDALNLEGTEVCMPDEASVTSWRYQVNSASDLTPCSVDPPVNQPPAEENPSLDGDQNWLIGVIGAFAGIACVFSLLAFIMVRRKPEEPSVHAPESSLIASLQDQLSKIQESVAGTQELLTHQSAPGALEQEPADDIVRKMRSALDERDKEIRRFKRGYDVEVYRKFLTKFARLDQAFAYFEAQEQITADNLVSLRRLLANALEDCGVEPFAPMVGADYRTAFGVSDHPKVIDTKNPGDDFVIAEVLEMGYQVRGTSQARLEVLIPARVAVFRYK